MIFLKQEQMEWMRTDLQRRGLLYPPLREEIVDHICEAVEMEMGRGISFMDAYKQVVASFGPHGLPDLNEKTVHFIGTLAMLQNYLKIAFRNLRRHKLSTLINLFGLVLGISSCLLILLYVQDELSYDNYHLHADRIFRLTTKVTFPEKEDHAAWANNSIGTQLATEYPEVENVIRLQAVMGKVTVKVPGSTLPASKSSEQLFNLDNVYFVYDPAYFKVFTHPMLVGSAHTALTEPGSVVITETLAKRCFGLAWREGESILGKVLQFNKANYQITGVIRDVPSNTDQPFQALLRKDDKQLEPQAWCSIYVQFRNGAAGQSFGPKLDNISRKLEQNLVKGGGIKGFQLFLENLREIHLSTPKTFDTPKANRAYISIFSLVAGFLLLIAGINYVNLSVAQSGERSTEVGIRKVIGASRLQLLLQFLGESLLLTLTAVILSLALIAFILPFYNQLTDKNFSLFSIFSWQLGGTILGIFILVGIIAGSYPAFYLASFEPINALKGKLCLTGRSLRGLFGQGLVVLQFAIAVVIVIGTVIVFAQLRYLQNKNLGFQKEQVLVLDIPQNEASMKAAWQLKQVLAQYVSFQNVALCGSKSLPSQEMNLSAFHLETGGKLNKMPQHVIDIDENYLNLLGIPLVAGRSFSPRKLPATGEPRYSVKEVLINEALVQKLGWGPNPQAAIGKSIISGSVEDETSHGKIIGVVKDFHFQSPHKPIEPLILQNNGNYFPEKLLVRLSAGQLPKQIDFVKKEWTRLLPLHPFEFTFLDEAFDQQYRQEQRMLPIFTYFSFITIFVAFIGLFGLVSFATGQRLKEMGIRKVMGANEQGLVWLLSRKFLILVGLAVLIACPLAWLLMKNWLEEFAYRTPITISVFLITAGGAMVMAILTTGYHALRTARTNPVKALRYE